MPIDFTLLNEHTLTAAGVTTQYLDRVRNIVLPPWLLSLAYLDDVSTGERVPYPIPEGEFDSLKDTPAGAASSFSTVKIKNVVVPSVRLTTGFTCDRKWLKNTANTQNILRASERSLESVRKYWVGKALAHLNNGHNVYKARDDKYLFASDHVIDRVTGISNTGNLSLTTLGASDPGTPTRPTADSLSRAVTEAIVNFMSIKNGPGEEDYVNGGNQSFHCIFPLGWMGAATQAFGNTLSAQFLNGLLSKLGQNQIASSNSQFTVEYSCVPGLSSSSTFFIYPTDTSEKPLLRRQESVDVMEFGYDSEKAKETGLASWLVELYGGFAPFFWERIYRAVLVS